MYQIFIETRGKLIDYKFILNEPKDKWWEEYEGLTTFEYTTILIENINNNPRIYLSGIPSERKDSKQTIIYYTLVIELDNNTDTDTDTVLKLVYKWLDEVQKSANAWPDQSDIGMLLDKQFPEPDVEKLLDTTTEKSEKNKILDSGLKKFMKNISNEVKPMESSVQCNKYQRWSRWWGGVQNLDSRKTWISLVDKLLKEGSGGKALLLNLVDKSHMKQLSEQLPDIKIGLLITNNKEEPQKFPSTRLKTFSKKKFFNWILTIPPIKYLYSRFHKRYR